MPTVPVVRGPEVSSRGIPAVTNNQQFSPNDFGAGIAQAGQGYVQAVADMVEFNYRQAVFPI
ncbi:hypothetical protein PEC302107_36080 [Pectobacterium araliae]|uniref:hypothetical protein n=1 Tax=Pectobacterium araliae TaxID=3073862 RepID=UPI0020895BCE|nr:hypothetical protein PEC302107_36080 [Pectobacterium carotovorum subsp. carotovorum]